MGLTFKEPHEPLKTNSETLIQWCLYVDIDIRRMWFFENIIFEMHN